MYRSEDEKQIDRLIGEAVMTLLTSGGPVDSKVLIDQLSQMALAASSPRQRALLQRALREVNESIETYRQHAERLPDARSLFDHHSSAARKH
ncbi:hypothetical protein BL250_15180 [Erwinia sp. OLTSP20]|uniref:hypothetical protein n=1 Tax=unclassified Erwinia TaxID=2622719 RepID=UPI000C18A894|nr:MULTISPECIES: hypothetical protein [unclassified Erwinia]PIJ48474.1 hypothetical protein BV501_16910 [Erwinia sp. OAMSP11]PIJ75970.1 hypothetical protein BK416_00315 [Erwinia sp. OLSSP12]PIJ78870.1 hypothetical protein BLD47_16260 [Erwinia sp. OLCASP19]PIJ87439.1 hypothetical protein BLD46_00390 [Erwinia sp. OLMTSP26]PIJ88989.1 hypothetical protein BLD49_00390 [Erwinia sp. OLMDSP33]